MSTNPWSSVGQGPSFILEEDRPFVEAFNSRLPEVENGFAGGHIFERHVPEPRLGPVNAPVVVLQLNPYATSPEPNAAQALIAERLESLRDEQYPHAGLLSEDRTGWWSKRYGALLKALESRDVQPKSAARLVCSIEYFPYHSKSFHHGHLRLPSQAYTFDLVRQAVRRRATFLITRGAHLWFGAVPELAGYDDIHETNSMRYVGITPGNLKPGVFEHVVKRVADAAVA